MKTVKIIASCLGLMAASMLNAGVAVSYDAAGLGTTFSGGSFTAFGGGLINANKNGLDFLGVTGGSAGPEIDLGQSILVNFDDAVVLDSISFGLLFDGPEYGDLNEIAASFVNGADEYTLKAFAGADAGEWYKNGVLIANVTGSGIAGGGFGLWTIDNPFEGSAVETMLIYPKSSPGAYSNSDFGLVAFSGVTVPDAGASVALLGLGLLALVGFARRTA